MSAPVGNGRTIVGLSGAPDVNEQIIRPSVTTLHLGEGTNFRWNVPRVGSQKFVKDVLLQYTVSNTSATATDDFYWRTLWHLLSSCRVMLNGKKVYEMPSSSMLMGYRWQQATFNSSLDEDHHENGVLSDEFLGVNTATVTGYSLTGVGGTGHATLGQSQFVSQSLKWFLYPMFDQLPLPFLYTVDLEFELVNDDGNLIRHIQFKDPPTVAMGTQLEISGLEMRVIYANLPRPTVLPQATHMIIPNWAFRNYGTVVDAIPNDSASHEIIINLNQDFPLVRNLKNVYICLIPNTKAGALLHSDGGAISSIAPRLYAENLTKVEFKVDGTKKWELETANEVLKHQNATQTNWYGTPMKYLQNGHAWRRALTWQRIDVSGVHQQLVANPAVAMTKHFVTGVNNSKTGQQIELSLWYLHPQNGGAPASTTDLLVLLEGCGRYAKISQSGEVELVDSPTM